MVSSVSSQTTFWSRESWYAYGRSHATVLLLSLGTVILGAVLGRWLFSEFDTDEIEHTHVTWALNQGIMPYRDIHQNHLPSLWVLSSPLLARLPESAETLIALRVLSLLAFFGVCLIAVFALREIDGAVGAVGLLGVVFIMLSMAPDFEFYRFRPDPWMAFFSACAILAAARLGRNPRRYAFLSGLSLGLAASLSPKMAPLGLLVPGLCAWEAIRLRSGRPLLLVLPNALGCVVGLLPAMAWIVAHGLFSEFHESCLSTNARNINLDGWTLARLMLASSVWVILPVLGGLLQLTNRSAARAPIWSPLRALFLALTLTWTIVALTPTHGLYNLQAFAMPAAVLGTLVFLRWVDVGKKLASIQARAWLYEFAAVASLILFASYQPLLACFFQPPPGDTICRASLQRLIDLCSSKDATCAAIAPCHPVFCRDATDLYLGWDYMLITVPWTPDAQKQKCIAMWQKAVDEIQKKRPTIVFANMGQFSWNAVRGQKVLTEDQVNSLARFLLSRYRQIPVDASGNATIFVSTNSDMP